MVELENKLILQIEEQAACKDALNKEIIPRTRNDIRSRIAGYTKTINYNKKTYNEQFGIDFNYEEAKAYQTAHSTPPEPRSPKIIKGEKIPINSPEAKDTEIELLTVQITKEHWRKEKDEKALKVAIETKDIVKQGELEHRIKNFETSIANLETKRRLLKFSFGCLKKNDKIKVSGGNSLCSIKWHFWILFRKQKVPKIEEKLDD